MGAGALFSDSYTPPPDKSGDGSGSGEKFEIPVRRFWIPPGKGPNNLVILVPKLLYYWEHNLRINGKRGHYAYCFGKGPQDGCLVHGELRGERAAYTGALGAINMTGFTSNRTGREYPHNPIILGPKGADVKKFNNWLEDHEGDLSYCEFRVRRSDAKNTSSIGDDWQFVKRWDPEQFWAKVGEDLYANAWEGEQRGPEDLAEEIRQVVPCTMEQLTAFLKAESEEDYVRGLIRQIKGEGVVRRGVTGDDSGSSYPEEAEDDIPF